MNTGTKNINADEKTQFGGGKKPRPIIVGKSFSRARQQVYKCLMVIQLKNRFNWQKNKVERFRFFVNRAAAAHNSSVHFMRAMKY